MAFISFAEAQRRISSINLQAVGAEAMQRRESDVTRMLKEQLYEGKRGDGKEIGEYLGAGYADYKHDLNPRAGLGNVDLFVTGEYYSKFSLEVGGQAYKFTNTDSKAAKLEAKYGAEINRLAPDTRMRLWVEVLRGEVVEILSDRTGFAIV